MEIQAQYNLHLTQIKSLFCPPYSNFLSHVHSATSQISINVVTAQPKPQPNSTSTWVGVDKVISWTSHTTHPHKLVKHLQTTYEADFWYAAIFGPNYMKYGRRPQYFWKLNTTSIFINGRWTQVGSRQSREQKAINLDWLWHNSKLT